jgi:hypothetical protein
MGIAQTWNTSYENTPARDSSPGLGDDQIRNLKSTVRTFNAKEHEHSLSATTTQGVHKHGSAMPYCQATEPSVRPDALSDFDEDFDLGRLWIDTSNGKLYYISAVDEEGVATWTAVSTETVGQIAAFPSAPDSSERWLLCDGSQINASDNPEYAALVTFLRTEAAGDTTHPFLGEAAANCAILPDLRGRVIRGVDSEGTRDVNTRYDINGDECLLQTIAGSSQDDAIIDHYHEIPHTHGSSISSGKDSGNGRTGVPSWLGGDPQPGDESGNWSGDSYLSTEGVLTMRDPGNTVDAGGFSDGADDYNVTVDLEHYHTIARFYGISSKFSEEAEDTTHGVPAPQDISYGDEATMKNVVLYYYIKY